MLELRRTQKYVLSTIPINITNCQSWTLKTDGLYLSSVANRAEGAEEVSAQETLIDAYTQRS